MTDEAVRLAAGQYAQGLTLVSVANEFGVHSRTLTREFSARAWQSDSATARPGR